MVSIVGTCFFDRFVGVRNRSRRALRLPLKSAGRAFRRLFIIEQVVEKVVAPLRRRLRPVQDGKVVLAKAYGERDVEANIPVTTATQFLICSITKSFTATGVAVLHDEGRLDWTKPVRE